MNIPVINPGIIAVSRDCFPIRLSADRRKAIVDECGKLKKDRGRFSVFFLRFR